MKADPQPARDRLKEAQQQRRKSRGPTGTAPKEKYMPGKTSLACNAGNVLLALQTEPELKGAFGYDEMLRTEMLRRPLFVDDPDFKPRPVTDADATAVQVHLRARELLPPAARLSHRLGVGTASNACPNGCTPMPVPS
jgi:hypothetical protein